MAADPDWEAAKKRLIERIESGEGQDTEFKQDFPDSSDDLARVVASFATCNQGRIFLGVNDRAEIVGLPLAQDANEATWKDDIQKRILGIVGKVDPRVRVEVGFAEVGEKKFVCEVFVPKGEEPVYFVGNIPYLRELSSSRKASPEEVKEYHRKFFEAALVVAQGMPETLLELLSQLVDLDIVLSDVDELHGNDMKQWRYDVESTARILRELSTSRDVHAMGADSETLALANNLDEMAATRIYADGGVSWEALLGRSRSAREDARLLRQRVGKRISISPAQITDMGRLLARNLWLVRDRWNRREDLLRQGRLSTFRSDLRRVGFICARFSILFSIGGHGQLADLSGREATLLRSIDRDLVFRPGVGRNPLVEMRDTMESVVSVADKIDKIVAARQPEAGSS